MIKGISSSPNACLAVRVRCHCTGGTGRLLADSGSASLPEPVEHGRGVGMTCRTHLQGLSSSAAAFEHHLVTSPSAQRAVGLWLAGGAAWVFSMVRRARLSCCIGFHRPLALSLWLTRRHSSAEEICTDAHREQRCDRVRSASLQVVIGGITRLTRSGLSMTDWKFTGRVGRPPSPLPPPSRCASRRAAFPTSSYAMNRPPRSSSNAHRPPVLRRRREKMPVTPEDWDEEFAKYKASPEFQKVNSRMTVEEFKFIFWWEYAHRMWGRALGVFFAMPLGIFLAKGYIKGPLKRRLGLFFLAGASQGLVVRAPPPAPAPRSART